MNDTLSDATRRPRVWVVYRDTRKDMSAAEKFGQLTDMFTGRVNYERAVYQVRKMLHNYQDGDFLLMVGDPALCGIVMAVALEFSETETLKLLRWDRDEVEYRDMTLSFGEEEDQPAEGVAIDSPQHGAEVTRRNRFNT